MFDIECFADIIRKLSVILDDEIITVHIPFIMKLLKLLECSCRNRACAAVLHKEEGLLFLK